MSDRITLRAQFRDGSAESYAAPPVGGMARMPVETLAVTWFATAGHFDPGTVAD